MKTLLLIYNPHAGKQRITAKLHDVVYHFTTAGYLVTVRPTLYRGNATQIAAEEGAKYDHVVCCGGDGTLNEVITGLLTHPERMPVLGYLPAGTTNDFAKTLKIPGDLDRSTPIAVAGTPCACDLGEFNGRAFVYVAAFGVFTEVSYATPQNIKNVLGRLAYVLEGIKSLSQLKTYHMKVTHDGETIEDDFIYGMVSDSISVGGFLGLKEEVVKLGDGLFEVMLIKRPKTLEELRSILNAVARQEPEGHVISFQSAELTFECQEPVGWSLDGEFGGDCKIAHVVNKPRAITIMRG